LAAGALANPISTEVLGLAGFDWLVLDANTRRTT
jgi:2-keto-3-deoxy-L-rhamnonate aldolase RhmA